MERLRSPILFLVLMLLPFLLYFTGWLYWWGLQIVIQVLLCLTGLFFPSWRMLSLTVLALLIFFTAPWFHFDSGLPKSCLQQLDHLSGVAESDRNNVRGNLRLNKIEIWCQKDFKRWPSGEIRFHDGKPPRRFTWFRKGDRISLRKVELSPRNPFMIDIQPTGRVRVTNLTYRERILDRSPILIYVQKKARYFLSGFPYAVYKALITADRSALTANWKKRFGSLGIFHIFAISGMHIGILYLWFSLVIRWIISFPRAWIEKGTGILVTDLVSILAIFLIVKGIGMPVSAVRAFIMLAWWGLIRHFLGWQPLWFILCGTAVVILIGLPVAAGQLSFQLSFLSVAGILQVLPFLPGRRLKDSTRKMFFKLLMASFVISLWLFILTMPLVGMITPEFSFITPLNNVFHIYFMSFIFLPAALLVVFVTLIGYPFGGLPVEFYLYSFLNILGKLWEKLLLMNDSLNRFFLSERPDFSQPLPVFAWIALAGAPFLINWYRREKQK